MKLSPLAQAKICAVMATAVVLLGCEAPSTTAGEQSPPVYPAVANVAQPDLVTVVNPAPITNDAGATVISTNFESAVVAPAELEAGEIPIKPVELSSRLQEVVKLAQSGVGDDVILAFIQNSQAPFRPTPEEIVYLTDLGISDVIITALVNHRADPPPVARQPAQSQAPAGMPPATTQPPAEATYNPEPQVVYSSPPVVQYVTPAPAVEYDYFYSSLTPYGSWVEVSDYGMCWQPTVAVVHRGWRPYCDRGRWLSTDCGWYWQSDYSWGWAPFHYGRWFNHPVRGWCWRPDSVWAPAWVSWRYTDSHCGWAPLPPGSHYRAGVGFTYYGAAVGVSFGFGLHRDAWTFVPGHRFHDREIWRHRVELRDHANVYRQSRVVNNYVVNNNVIINRGVGPDRVPSLGRSEARPIAIRDVPDRGSRSVRPDRLHQDGSQVVVYRPKPMPTEQQNLHAPNSDGSRPVRSQPGARPGSTGIGSGLAERPAAIPTPTVRSGNVQPANPNSARPYRALGSEASNNSVPTSTQNGVAPTRSQGIVPSSAATPQPVRNGSVNAATATPSVAPRLEVAPSAQAPAVAAPQGYRPAPINRPSWDRPTSPGAGSLPAVQNSGAAVPQASGPALPTYRQERPKPATSVAPERMNSYSAPPEVSQPSAPAYSGPRTATTPRATVPAFESRSVPNYSSPAVQSRPAPSYNPGPVRNYSAPAVQSRPVPSYTPPAAPSRPAPSYSAPAVQSRPAQSSPSYSVPASRSTPQAAPTPNQTSRSGNRRD